jgi:quercetin dioxygenase-like cupin family protein
MAVSTPDDIVAIRADVVSGMGWQQLGGMPHVRVKELWSSQRAVAGLLRIDPHAREVAHLHSHGQHHLWVLDGHVEINGIGLPEGSYVHVPAGALHALTNRGEQACTLGFVFLPA